MKSKLRSKRLSQTAAANRRKRMLANNKKKVIWRNRAYKQFIAA